MQVSPSSSEARRDAQAWCGTHGLRVAWLFPLLFALAGCATVRPEEKEFLAEPSMTWSSGDIAKAHEDHVIENREGSFGGGTKGGGCGCN